MTKPPSGSAAKVLALRIPAGLARQRQKADQNIRPAEEGAQLRVAGEAFQSGKVLPTAAPARYRKAQFHQAPGRETADLARPSMAMRVSSVRRGKTICRHLRLDWASSKNR